MFANIRRYGRAFLLALRYTLRGEKPPLLAVRDSHPELAAWWAQTITLVEAVERAAAANGIDPKTVTIRADRRDVSMTTILGTVRFHAERDYPYLLAHQDQHDRLAMEALNLNDRYLVAQLANTVAAPLRSSVDMLVDHLANLPVVISK